MKKLTGYFICLVFIVFVIVFRGDIVKWLSGFEFMQSFTGRIAGMEKPDEQVADVGTGYYAYAKLNKEEQLVYNQMAECLFQFQDKVTLSTKVEHSVDRAFHCLLYDHPEIFWTDSYEMTTYSLGKVDTEYEFKPIYNMSKEQVQQKQKSIDKYVSSCFEGLDSTDEYEIAKYLFDYLVEHTVYKEGENSQNISSVFVEGQSVCMGYSKAYEYLLQKKGIESVIVSGMVDGESHAWNLVKLDGEYYHMDVTWGDIQLRNSGSATSEYIDYNFFGVTTDDILKTHVIDSQFELPECDNTACNYYVKEGYVLEQFQEESLEEILKRQSGNKWLTIRCKNQADYEKVYGYLIKQEKIYKILGVDKITYMENVLNHTLSIMSK